VGALFFRGATAQIAHYAALDTGGSLSVSLMVQLNANQKGRGNVLVRLDDSWGLEWWGESRLNFFLRGPKAPLFRAVQAEICSCPACYMGWVRVSMSYNASAPFASSISMFAAGKRLTQQASPASPGTMTGKIANSSSSLWVNNLDGMALADLIIYGSALPASELAR